MMFSLVCTVSLLLSYQFVSLDYNDFQWSSYLRSFDGALWTFVILSSLIGGILLWGFDLYFSKFGHGFSIFNAFGISFGASFGMTVIDANESNSRSKKILLLTIFLSGNAIFIAYQAELTSALSVPSNKLPFRSPEELLQTDYRYTLVW